jgi:hypothetical protein
MWLVAGIVSLTGFALNIYMAATWFVLVASCRCHKFYLATSTPYFEPSFSLQFRTITGLKYFKTVEPQLRNTVFLGIFYGLIDTLPMVIL